ncbi:MAG: glycoside hydrolase 100 family protein, partial [Rhodothermales bacterium]|nr:glycoside hydrolase 100 family protein [Rhodothermales bacterium]
MTPAQIDLVEEAKGKALEILRHNAKGAGTRYGRLFRTAGWAYPEAYTRDMMLSALGVLVSGDDGLVAALRRVIEALAENRSARGHTPSLAHDPDDRGASDTTPLFLVGAALFRRHLGQPDYLHDAVDEALQWMAYQSPDDRAMVAQLPTTDWRDEHWVLGYGLYTNALVYAYLRLLGRDDKAEALRKHMNRLDVANTHKSAHRALVMKDKPYFALWSYKIERNERFDLLGNSLAILTGLAAPARAKRIVHWLEGECDHLRERGELAGPLPPCLIPYIQPPDSDWRRRYEEFNPPGAYHNGGIWPFICGFYVAALVAARRHHRPQPNLEA